MSNEEPEYVTFVSSDGFEFVVKRSAACVSDTVKRMLNSRSTSPPLQEREGLILLTVLIIVGFAESITNRCVFGEIKYVEFCRFIFSNEILYAVQFMTQIQC